MSATSNWFTEHAEKLEAWAKELLKHKDPAVKAVGRDVEKTAAELKGDAEKIEATAKTDAEAVAKEAEPTIKPANEISTPAAGTTPAAPTTA
jgi:phage-related tail protein